MSENKNNPTVLSQLAALHRMSIDELKERWSELYDEAPPDIGAKFLIKRLAYRIQEIYYGGLTKTDTDKITKINKDMEREDKRSGKDDQILSGTRFVREWNGNEYVAVAREDGFEYNGRLFSSLSAVANEITGTRWNGLVFFGLKKRAARRTPVRTMNGGMPPAVAASPCGSGE